MKKFYTITTAALIISMICTACNNETPTTSRTPIVKVYDKYLYAEDIATLVPEGTTPQDSALKVKSYVEVWVRKQLMIKKAELYLTDEQKNVERQLEDYRASLLIYKYKDKYLSENFDTTVTPQEIISYYNNHPDDFKLQRNAVKAFFVRIPLESTDITKLKMLLDFRSEKDSIRLIDFCREQSLNYDNFGFRWMSFAEAMTDMPENFDENSDKVKSKGTISQSDERYMYLLKIRDFLPAGSVEPFEMAQHRVANVVLTSKKTKCLSKLEDDLYDNAEKNGNLEYFNTDKNKE